MTDFAKIITASDGAQVLYYKTTDDEGKPALKHVTEHEDITVEMTASFKDDEWDARNAAFVIAGTLSADKFRAFLKENSE